LLRNAKPRWVVIENVRNMLVLDGDKAMKYLISELEELKYRWDAPWHEPDTLD
jgi:DNA (cytosine-5)-methyltransferase 1